jgi:hypothetical protein
MSDKRYYLRARGKIIGPLSATQLRTLQSRGQISALDEVSEDRQNWTPASEVQGLFPDSQSPIIYPAAPAAPEVPPEVFETEPDEVAPRRRRRPGFDGSMAGFGAVFYRIADIPTWLFGAGALLVIVFLFLPLIDQAKIASRQAAVSAGELREARLERALLEKKDRTPDDEEIRRKGREHWRKEKESLQEAVEETRINDQRAPYWHRWGMLAGFLLLAGAALGYLRPEQPTIRRVVGSIVILSEVVLIFIVFVLSSAMRL